ncbi:MULTISPECIES: N-acetyltransferase [unclassified Pseudomonas]|uniref:GNAT family N-acetyltransferase n=1 Tax=unclassified Pseudomonas TaxID=196821 RepID=UPI0006247A6D|nr:MULTISPECIES: N-acetyltransferase [unclassified Pseudomonas]PMZ94250.1 N-acetyltransferase [Pseudomonas sp. FW305-42]PNA21343.1 N-acetyltransferase [Pseudomonas sp. MPR-R1B]PNB23935.1 N-acetyltransferase [Pseudomonas sp. DP16D-E2]PNB41738.1 N-acetyltransferase [Pseudomonas sp. FW305-17]PNB57803.1 N-acetyltransferase [Pseudomonas sp. GW531-E2]
MPYQIRPARDEDCVALSLVGQATFALASPPDSAVSAQQHYIAHHLQPEHFQAHLEHPHKRLLVVERDGQVLGYSMLDLAPGKLGIAEADQLAEISRCYVLPCAHGTGAAQLLLATTLAQVDGQARLTVNELNARAIGFYQRNGFRKVGEAIFPCGDERHRDWVMVRMAEDHLD